MVGGEVGVGEPEHDERPCRRGLHQAHGGAEDRRARALGADQRAGEVEAVLGEELVEVVAADPARQLGRIGPDEVLGLVAEGFQLAVDPPFGAGTPTGLVEVGGRADVHPRPVGEQDVEGVDVVDGLAPGHRVGAAGVVADHPAEGAAVVGRRVRAEGEAVGAGGVAQVVEDRAGLDDRRARVRVEVEHAAHVTVEVDHHRLVHRLPADAGARPQRQDRDAVVAGREHRGLDVVGVHRLDDPERHVAVVRRVGRPHRARGGVEPDRAAHRRAQRSGEQRAVRVGHGLILRAPPGVRRPACGSGRT